MANLNANIPQDTMEFIRLKVINQESKEVHFRIRANAPLKTLKQSYANHVGTNVSIVKFLFEGRLIRDDDTPISLEMEPNDVIETYNAPVEATISA